MSERISETEMSDEDIRDLHSTLMMKFITQRFMDRTGGTRALELADRLHGATVPIARKD